MAMPARVLCIMDLSCCGRAGLAVVLPALAACGAQGCGVPAALFSAHTGGFGPVEKLDTAAFGEKALEHYRREGVAFDAVYIGYLYGEAQFRLARLAIDLWPEAFVVVDPALADDGRLYSGMGEETVAAMGALCERASLITPNATESALLCGRPAAEYSAGQAALAARLQALSGAGGKGGGKGGKKGRSVVITSAVDDAGRYQTLGCGPGGAGAFSLPSNRLPVRYPGSGDLFTAALVGSLLAGANEGQTLQKAAEAAARFVEAAIHATHAGGGEPRHGVWFEPYLYMLAAGETGDKL